MGRHPNKKSVDDANWLLFLLLLDSSKYSFLSNTLFFQVTFLTDLLFAKLRSNYFVLKKFYEY